MQPNADGKFCMHCSKTVIDFTQQTSYEIKSYFQQNKENTCGRFTNQQLKETYTIYESSKFDHYKFVASLALGLLTLDTLNAFSIDGKDFKNEKDSVQIVKMINNNEIQIGNENTSKEIGVTKILQNDSVILKGNIRDSATNEPLIGVNVTIKNTTHGVVTNYDGNFEIKVNNDLPVVLVFSYVAVKTTFIEISESSKPINIKFAVDKELINSTVVGGARRIDSFSKKEARKYKRKHKH